MHYAFNRLNIILLLVACITSREQKFIQKVTQSGNKAVSHRGTDEQWI